MRRTWALLSSTIFLSAVAGCASKVGSVPGEGSGAATSLSPGVGGGSSAGSGGATGAGATGSASSSSGGTGAGSEPGQTSDDACPTTALEPTPLRRLTRFEYANTVADLLKVDPSPANDLPADEVSNGYDNDSGVLTVSSLHAEKYVLVSEALAKAAVQNLSALTDCDTASQGEEACARAFAQRFGRRAFRRPLTDQDEQALMTAYAAGRDGGSYAEGIEVMIRAALQSPDFLYRLETTTPVDSTQQLVPLSQFELATRLSFMIWGMGPDDALLDAAENGALATKEQVAQKAREMLQDPRARIGLTNFFGQWAGINRLSITTKNTTLFPSFSNDMRDAMGREFPAFVEHVLWQGDHSLRALLTEPVAFVSGPLGQVYGVNAPAGSDPTTPVLVDLPPEQGRSGLLTEAAFLAVQGHPDQTSPVLRGKFVRTMLLCDPPPPPPNNVDTSLPTIDEGATARERFSAHASGSCQGCHSHMDPIGFAFENFDAMGQYRTLDNGQPIDATGEIIDPIDPSLAGTFNGVQELGQKLAASSQVSDCVATQWFRFASGRLEAAPDQCSLQTLRQAFTASHGDLVELVVAMTQTDNFWYRTPVID